MFFVECLSLVIDIPHLRHCPGEVLPGLLQSHLVVVRHDLADQSRLAGQQSHGKLGSFLLVDYYC